MTDRYAAIRLKNQLCFPLYAVSNMITRRYKPLLDKLDLTYTQYIVMMVLWEEEKVNEKCRHSVFSKDLLAVSQTSFCSPVCTHRALHMQGVEVRQKIQSQALPNCVISNVSSFVLRDGSCSCLQT